MEEAIQSDMFRKSYGEVFEGDERWNVARECPAEASCSRGTSESTYVRRPPFFDGLPREPEPIADIDGARALARARRQRHHRPHLARRVDQARQPGRRVPDRARRGAEGLQLLRSRRGNHEVMMRGTFANIRLRNQLARGTEGGVTIYLGRAAIRADADLRRRDAIYEEEGMPLIVLAGKEYGSGSSRDWAAKGGCWACGR